MKYRFTIGTNYTRKDVKTKVGHPNPGINRDDWATGYTTYRDCYFIFATTETAGRTGHDYPNILTKDELYWFSKNNHTLDTFSIKQMMSGNHEVYIFTREDSSDVNFIFKGLGYVKDFEDGKPAHIVWGFIEDLDEIPEKYIANKRKQFIEGAKKESTITRYERNSKARNECLDHYGYGCQVCEMKFEDEYGQIGEKYIHVHHEIEISSIGEEYEIDPINDLKPVCPNCHAMLHKRKPAYSIDELKGIRSFCKTIVK
ncbi:HNH endonuclease [Solibacillus daqui]|uniref:HNH endonuclease n=1 Tax=Solibacillus daqui TaxID=2912187 RepID=UPI00236703E7|nr:DUF3427 domain-containing protein [Solibacillus daqui]